ncbi:Type 1 glutamine amidotransferase domain-containing protein [Sulfidibacter corallicola]|uniref:Type 1 glutamine amidotransferase domain-containing protein n=1 Tax=Sulfidibacter corallicola TaxID=2818388 RepID=A0A8A4TQV0_SULCO|nr:type 1 glutamine amidotransferase domain-containing protein [Sulfidibacter corallicola]QTD48905.1 type 1 glutamine amidotransferase domain-containing protein [Sulfidibacter corallicola]
MTAQKILVLLTNVETLAGEPNGTYFPELSHAAHELEAAGLELVFASLTGGAAPYYGADRADELNARYLDDQAFMRALSRTHRLDQVDISDFKGIYVPGGYGLLFDLCRDDSAAAAIAAIYDAGEVVGAVCHGPAALAGVRLASGEALVAGREITGFTREEEVAFGTLDKVPFLLEETLAEAGGQFHKAPEWEAHVRVAGRLVTGQNPASAAGVGRAIAAKVKNPAGV